MNNLPLAKKKCETILGIIASKESTTELDELYDKVESVLNYIQRYDKVSDKQSNALDVWLRLAEEG